MRITLLQKLFFSLLSVFALSMMGSFTAYSQTTLPEFSLSDLDADTILPDIPSDTVIQKIDFNRPLTRDIFSLQEQINLLEALIMRQSEIKKIAENYKDLDIPFNQPAPLLSVCQKLPINLLCFHAYPDLQKNNDLLLESENIFRAKQEENVMAVIEEMQLAALSQTPEADLSQDGNILFSPPVQESFAWSDVQCLRDTCSVLLQSSLDDNKIFRVSVGDQLPNNSVMARITPFEVEIKTKDGDVKMLKEVGPDLASTVAQPSNNVAAPDPSAQVEKGGILDLLRQNVPRADSAPSTTSLNDNAEVENSDTEQSEATPLLGPTGLF